MDKTGENNLQFGYLPFYFAFYSFLGWLAETICVSASKETLVNRGFLFGPFCPVYGFGIILLLLLLYPLKSDPILFFTGAAVLTSALELVTGVLLKLVFNRTWWNYDDIAFNLGGFICLKNSILWGVASVLVIRFIHPLVQRLVLHIPDNTLNIVSRIIFLYFAIDLLITVNSLVLPGYGRRLLTSLTDSVGSSVIHVRQLADDTVKSFMK